MDLIIWRACVCALLQFKLLARQSEILKLRACDFYDANHSGVHTLEVKFRKSKTDPQYNGHISFIPATGDKFCIYRIIRAYFDFTGMVTADSQVYDHSFLLSRTATDGTGIYRNRIQTYTFTLFSFFF